MISIVAKRDSELSVNDVLERSWEAREAPSVLQRWLKVSDEVWYGMLDGELLCVYGLATPSMVSNRAYLWMISTDLMEQHKFLFIRHSQLVVEDALKVYDMIMGHVAADNAPARKWLKWLGAQIEPVHDGYSVFRIRRK
jgi:hypothetical protein